MSDVMWCKKATQQHFSNYRLTACLSLAKMSGTSCVTAMYCSNAA